MTCPTCNAIVSIRDTECPLCHTPLSGSNSQPSAPIPPAPQEGSSPISMPVQTTPSVKSKSKLPVIIVAAVVVIVAAIAILPKGTANTGSTTEKANTTTESSALEVTTENNFSESFSKLVKPDEYIDGGKKIVSPSVGLNLRYGPSESYDIIALLPYATQVEIVGTGNNSGWVYVYCESLKINGWVAERYLVSGTSSSSNQTDVSYFSQSYTAIVTPSVGLNLRSGPGENFQSIKLLKQGTAITVLARSVYNYDWLYVRIENGNYDYYGFVHSDYVS